MTATHYDVLGVPVDATTEEVVAAFRAAARLHHPDVNPNSDAEVMAALTRAYSVLSKPAARVEYDLELGLVASPANPRDPVASEAHSTADPQAPVSEDTDQEPLPPAEVRGLDYFTAIRISAAEARDGCWRFVPVTFAQPCIPCRATGFDTTALNRTCSGCGGFKMRPDGSACALCGGLGKVSDTPCATCAGEGARIVSDALTVQVPPNMPHRGCLRLPRKGLQDIDGHKRGNVSVEVHIAGGHTGTQAESQATAQSPSGSMNPSATRVSGMSQTGENVFPGDTEPTVVRAGLSATEFTVATNGADVGIAVPATYTELRLGCVLLVADPTGVRHQLVVPAGSQPGTVLRVRGAGRPDATGQPADLHARLMLWMPTDAPEAAEVAALHHLPPFTT